MVIDDTVATSFLEVDRDIYVDSFRVTDASWTNTITSGSFSNSTMSGLPPGGSIVDQGGTLFVGRIAPIPEPSASALLVGAVLALPLLRRRRQVSGIFGLFLDAFGSGQHRRSRSLRKRRRQLARQTPDIAMTSMLQQLR
jgi:hypothetical protein